MSNKTSIFSTNCMVLVFFVIVMISFSDEPDLRSQPGRWGHLGGPEPHEPAGRRHCGRGSRCGPVGRPASFPPAAGPLLERLGRAGWSVWNFEQGVE